MWNHALQRAILGATGLLFLSACAFLGLEREMSTMDDVAERYVKLVLAVGLHDEGYVDAYYGPEQFREEVEEYQPTLDDCDREAADLITELEAISILDGPEILRLRHQYLLRQIQSLRSRISMLHGKEYRFDEESLVLYDAVAPHLPESAFEGILAELDQYLSGEGTLVERYTAFRDQFVIPPDKLDTVFQAAIRECRRRTLKRMKLPEGESFKVEYVKGKAWSAYNWYKGNSYSVIQVNVDLPIHIDRAIDLACHEGYPGHHVYNTLLEEHLVRQRGWIEYSVYPLFSPQSLIAEGTANFGIEVAFPGRERLEFERSVLFPLAGIDPAKAESYHTVELLRSKLDYAGNEAARRYLNFEIDESEAIGWLTKYALMSKGMAERRVRFYDKYRSYVINYNLGQDMVRAYIDRKIGGLGDADARWREFMSLLSSPRLPSGLK